MSHGGKYRSNAIADQVIGLSVSYQRDHLLARGLGLEHLRELWTRLARPLLRQGASLAYGGHWQETEDNFTFDLLRLINAEREDSSFDGPDPSPPIGRLYNHSPWPAYLEITPRIEAQWISCCRIVRISQQRAGIAAANIVPDHEVLADSNRARFNAAVTLSAMRRLAMDGMTIDIPDAPHPETVPPIGARVLLGGKVEGYGGFLPGLFEEALVTLERQRPLYLLGGFGGAAEGLAQALLDPVGSRPEAFTVAWQTARTPNVERLQILDFQRPAGIPTTADSLDALFQRIEAARPHLADALDTGLDEPETRELLTTRNLGRAVQLVLKGLKAKMLLPTLPA